MNSDFAIETCGLTRRYGDLVAVDNLNLKVKYGEVFGLLGPNGAGKTTTISMLCTMARPSAGSAVVNGYDVVKKPAEVRRSIGIVFQDPSVDISLTARENLKLHACLYDVPGCEKSKKIDEVLELVGLTDRADSRMRTFSGGMRRRLEIARGLLHNPTILFLDEPTLGLDPQTREHIWNYIQTLVSTMKITIVMTTHYMEEADRLCSRVAIIDSGKIKIDGSPAELKSTMQGDVITVITTRVVELEAALKGNGITPDGDVSGNTLRITVQDGEKLVPKVIEIAGKSGIQVSSISVHQPTLNDVFLHYTGREIRADEPESMGRVFMRSWRKRR